MKIKKLKIKTKLLQLFCIKSRIHEYYGIKHNKNSFNTSFIQTLSEYKKALKIIVNFHKKNKKILFLGLKNLTFINKINKFTNHTAVHFNIKLQKEMSLFSSLNKLYVKKHSTNKYSLFEKKKTPDLLVIFETIENYDSVLNESYMLKIPTITFANNLNYKKNKFSVYNVFVNIDFLLNNYNFFYSNLKVLFLKKKIKTKTKFPFFSSIVKTNISKIPQKTFLRH